MSNRFGLTEGTVQKIKTVLAAHPEVEQAILYGSRAKGTYRPGSDIDITLQGVNLSLDVLNRIKREIDDLLLPHTLDISIHHQIDNPQLLEHIDRVGISIYQQATDPGSIEVK